MSVIRRIPFIEKVLNKMDSNEKAELHFIVNSSGQSVNCGMDNLPEKGVYPVYFQLGNNTFRTGILVYTDDHQDIEETQCILICYHRFQDLELFEINTTNKTYRKIYEYCSIEELRRALDDAIKSEVQSVDGEKNVEFAKNVEIDGNLIVNSDIHLNGDFKKDGKTYSLDYRELHLSKNADGYVSTENFTYHVHIALEIDTNGIHTGADFVLHPYDISPCFVPFTLLANGNYVNGHGYMTDDGKVHIVIPQTISATTIKALYKTI